MKIASSVLLLMLTAFGSFTISQAQAPPQTPAPIVVVQAADASEPEKTAAEELRSCLEKITRFDYNFYSHPGDNFCYPVGGAFANWQALGEDAHSLVGDPGFVNPQADDYSLRPDSPALRLGFEPIDARQIGLLRPRCQCHSPRVPWGPNKQ